MPLETVHRISCSNCGTVEEEKRTPVPNQTAPAFVVPDGWVEFAPDKHLCPACAALFLPAPE